MDFGTAGASLRTNSFQWPAAGVWQQAVRQRIGWPAARRSGDPAGVEKCTLCAAAAPPGADVQRAMR